MRVAVALAVEGDSHAVMEQIVLDVIHTYSFMPELVAAFERAERWQGLPPGNRAVMARAALIREAIAAGCDPDPWRCAEVADELTEIERAVAGVEFRAALDALDRRDARKHDDERIY